MESELYNEYFNKLAHGGTPVGGMEYEEYDDYDGQGVYGDGPPRSAALIEGQKRFAKFFKEARSGKIQGLSEISTKKQISAAYQRIKAKTNPKPAVKRPYVPKNLTAAEKKARSEYAKARRQVAKQALEVTSHSAFSKLSPAAMRAIEVAAYNCMQKKGTPKMTCYAPKLKADGKKRVMSRHPPKPKPKPKKKPTAKKVTIKTAATPSYIS
jgi:hypothetical protein